jgi:hypothetical protein
MEFDGIFVYGVWDFMAFYGLKYDLTDNYGVVVGIIFQ